MNSTFAMVAAIPVSPPNPRSAAAIASTIKITVQLNICGNYLIMLVAYGFMHVVHMRKLNEKTPPPRGFFIKVH
jgi:hypothetical protein